MARGGRAGSGELPPAFNLDSSLWHLAREQSGSRWSAPRAPVPRPRAPARAQAARCTPHGARGYPPPRTCLSFHQHPGDAQGPATLGRIPVAGGFLGGTPGNNSQLVLRAWGEVGAPLCAELRTDLGALHPYTPLDPEICLGMNRTRVLHLYPHPLHLHPPLPPPNPDPL